MMEADTLSRLIAVAEAEGIRVISDEIYHGLDYAFAAETAANLSERALVINSFSKYFCMTGWRVGWMVVPESLVRTVDRLQGNLAISVPTLAQVAARSRLRRPRRDGSGQARLRGEPPHSDRGLAEGRARQVPARRRRLLSLCRHFALLQRQPRFRQAHARTRRAWRRRPGIDFDPVNGHNFLRFCYAGSAAEMHEAVAIGAG